MINVYLRKDQWATLFLNAGDYFELKTKRDSFEVKSLLASSGTAIKECGCDIKLQYTFSGFRMNPRESMRVLLLYSINISLCKYMSCFNAARMIAAPAKRKLYEQTISVFWRTPTHNILRLRCSNWSFCRFSWWWYPQCVSDVWINLKHHHMTAHQSKNQCTWFMIWLLAFLHLDPWCLHHVNAEPQCTWGWFFYFKFMRCKLII